MRFIVLLVLLCIICSGFTAHASDICIYWCMDYIDTYHPTEDQYIFEFNTALSEYSKEEFSGYIIQGGVPGESFYLVEAADHSIYDGDISILYGDYRKRSHFNLYCVTNSGRELIINDCCYDDMGVILAYYDGVLYYYSFLHRIVACYPDGTKTEREFCADDYAYFPFVAADGTVYELSLKKSISSKFSRHENDYGYFTTMNAEGERKRIDLPSVDLQPESIITASATNIQILCSDMENNIYYCNYRIDEEQWMTRRLDICYKNEKYYYERIYIFDAVIIDDRYLLYKARYEYFEKEPGILESPDGPKTIINIYDLLTNENKEYIVETEELNKQLNNGFKRFNVLGHINALLIE